MIVRVGEFSAVMAFMEHWACIKFKLSVSAFMQDKYHLLLINSEVIKNLLCGSKQGLKNDIWKIPVGVIPVKPIETFARGGGKYQLF